MNGSLVDHRYKTIEPLGEGAMGQVWLAVDETNERQVALKVVSTKLGANDKSRLQFRQEFRLMAQLRHPNCCQVYAYGETDAGEPYFTMELVPGQGLDELLAASGTPARGLDEGTFRKVFAQLMLALGYIHGLGLVHGDLKSANVRIRPDGTVKLMDYGLMDYAGRAGGPIRGTPAYMAPEVIKRGRVDRRSDLYSAGCLAYELLTGVLPFGGTQETLTATQLLRQHVAEQPLPLSTYKPGLSPELDKLIFKLLAKEPLERFQSAFEVLEALGAEVPAGIGGALLGSPLIGRREALDTLGKAITRLSGQTREGGALVVVGPAGIGKSRLLEEFRFAAQLEGVPCPGGECFEQGSPPYGPFLGVLKALAPAFKDQLPAAMLDVHAPVLVKLLPELGVAPAPDLENPKNEMMRMQTAIAHVLGALARRRPYALVLENWQWADPLSVELLDYLLRNLGDAPLLVVVTTREAPAAGRTVAAAARVELGGLFGQELFRMVSSMLGTPAVDAGFVAKIEEFSEGNPFMVERLLEHLVQTHVLVSAGGRWNTATALANYELPLGLQAVLLRKFDALAPHAQAIARLGAVIGRQFDLALVAELTGFADDRLFEALEQLQQSQVLQQDDQGQLSFVQDQVAELVYGNLDAPTKQQLHAAVAHALERQLKTEIAEAPLELVMALARHAQAGRLAPERALAYLLEAGERNRRLHDMAAAERYIGAGLEVLEILEPEALPHLRLGLWIAFGELKRQTGRSAEGRPYLERGLALADRLGVKPVGRLIGSLGKTQQIAQDFAGALETFTRSVETCLAEEDPTGASRARLGSARVHLFSSHSKLALADAEEALAHARTSGDRTQLGLAHALIGYLAVASAPERLEEGVEHLKESLALLAMTGDQLGLSTSYQLLGNAQLVLGDFDDARTSFTQNRRCAFQTGSREEEAFACLNLAIVELEQAHFEEARTYAAEAREKVERLNSRFPQGTVRVVEADALAYLGDEVRSRELSAEGLAIAREIKHSYLEGLALGHRCELLALLGRPDEALEAASALQQLMASTGNYEPESRLNTVLAELLVRKGDLDGARAAAESALEAAEATQSKGIRVRALVALARVALARGEFAEAIARATDGLELSRRIGTRYQSAMLLGLMGEAALALGDTAAARHFDEMATIAQALAFPPLHAMARFGQAASRPYEGGAERAAEAKALFEAWLDRLGPEGRAAFPAYKERRRVLEGNYIGFSLPLRTRPVGRGTQPLGLPAGLRGTNEL